MRYMLGLEWPDIERYLFTVKKMKRGLKDRNVKDYRSKFARITEYFLHCPFDKNNIHKFFEYLEKERHLQPPTLNNFLKLLKHICRYIGADYLDDFEYYTEIEPYIEVLNEDEILRLIECAYKLDYRSGVICETFSKTGLRSSELSLVKWSDYINNIFILRDTKSKEIQKVYVPPDLGEKINKLDRFPHDYIFGSRQGAVCQQTINTNIKKAATCAGITKKVWCHLLRHSAGTMAWEATRDLRATQEFLRHKDIGTTVRYTHLTMDHIIELVNSMPINANAVEFDFVVKLTQAFKNRISKFPIANLSYQEDENGIDLSIRKTNKTT